MLYHKFQSWRSNLIPLQSQQTPTMFTLLPFFLVKILVTYRNSYDLSPPVEARHHKEPLRWACFPASKNLTELRKGILDKSCSVSSCPKMVASGALIRKN